MNGRIYDPTLGRFLQADPHIQAPTNSQSYNRYSYVLNNPLSYTDPSGYFFKKLAKAFGNLWQATVGNVLRAIAKVPILNAAVGFLACATGPIGCAAFGAASSFAVTGSLKAALIGGFTAGIGGGHGFLTAGLVGGLASRIQGGNFGHGFWSAGIGALVGGRIKTGNAYLNVAVSAVVGGTVSKLTGGKFGNGAQTWAFSAAIAQDWASAKPIEEGTPEWEAREEEYLQKIIEEDRAMIQSGEGLYAINDNTFGASSGLIPGLTVQEQQALDAEAAGNALDVLSYATPYVAYKAAGYSFKFMRYENAGGYGFTWLKNGKRSFGIDKHPIPKLIGHNKNVWHFHAGKTRSQISKHRPYQGGWKWW
ncbi:hypothetical protein LP316_02400 [Thalassotalea sp. LPB0316]|uniref:RHS repeat-associated core domain-containing protein n=1 Tax=Thalassotalea sp. LPB0316 TaxID=2769490 RepID=UPI0018671A55|nr:RHS repeat-associated core domain-containing protein [Thalassotalea sp. LPB0316]QOL26174.1 hypothetical protein LP316_02400 [Thalassotalea sp. LPB0316]